MADIARKASAHWEGDLKSGNGTITTESGVLSQAQYSFKTRFENGKGTNPEELLASAHAGCFTMQLSALLAEHGHEIKALDTDATCEMVKDGPGFKINHMHLRVRAQLTGSDQADFEAHVKDAAEKCPLSRIMQGNVEVTHEAILEG
ncbi:OsmC family protein [Deinococcus radiodurans]|jgi:peroxiredoxin, OsmC subfamily|nr:OsmC family protein [Deinococcus radiodurans]ANC71337.1 osmotically inducible protein OsmC [Deinococcus radiodurans R1 = ATCC 13939 = DSM 20539]QIP29537.1 OsmC family protein [Deinococcus radiodurans]QIP31775.1 OsmC family protein [Deinococcus radiodurans]UID70515.1 osmotically inducible protein OsmC [Deinococcus radiodurans R1 = ATCC 13939 = DSM 20539]UTA50966.1 OsmC family protein [Deinococcus radiodurans]